MRKTIKTVSGQEFEIASCSCPSIFSYRNLLIDIINSDMMAVSTTFLNTEETETLTEYEDNAVKNVYEEYTNMVGMNYDIGSGTIHINMMQPEIEEDGVWEIHS